MEGWMERGVRTERIAKYGIASIIGGFGIIAIVVGVLTQRLDSLDGLGWPAAGFVLIVLGAFIAREGRRASRIAVLLEAWLLDEPHRIVWVYVRSGRDGTRLMVHRDDRALTSFPLASREDAAEAMVDLERRLPDARFGYRREWHTEFHAGQMR